jgi:hypothetical protein
MSKKLHVLSHAISEGQIRENKPAMVELKSSTIGCAPDTSRQDEKMPDNPNPTYLERWEIIKRPKAQLCPFYPYFQQLSATVSSFLNV